MPLRTCGRAAGETADRRHDADYVLDRQLDSNRYLVREQATQQLLAAGAAAFDPLLAAANGDRPEAADRAVWVLRKLGDSDDRQLALAALDRLVQVKDRPAVVAEARQIQSRLRSLPARSSWPNWADN